MALVYAHRPCEMERLMLISKLPTPGKARAKPNSVRQIQTASPQCAAPVGLETTPRANTEHMVSVGSNRELTHKAWLPQEWQRAEAGSARSAKGRRYQ